MSKLPNHPPKWADRFLEWYCREELLEEIQGDVYELFNLRSLEAGPAMARRRFIWDVFRSFRLSTIKGINLNHTTMLLRSNFKIAFRQMAKQKLYAAIKIGGFAISITVCLLIALLIREELSYDKHYEDQDQIYRILTLYQEPQGLLRGVHVPAPFAAAIQEEFPEIAQAGKLAQRGYLRTGANQIRVQGRSKNYVEDKLIFADSSIIDILEIPIIKGNPKTALSAPNTIVISSSIAEKYFPNSNPVGQSLIINDNEERPLEISGVMEDLPKYSHFRYDFLLSLSELEFWPGESSYWVANNYISYIKLREGTNPKALEEKMQSIIPTYFTPAFEKEGLTGDGDYSARMGFGLQAVGKIHLYSDQVTDFLKHGDIRLIWIFGTTAMVILLLACINFVNLSTARSAGRANEVGLRKVIGSNRPQLISQFLAESVLFSLFAFIIGLLIAQALLPYFNQVANQNIEIPWATIWFLPSVLLFSILIGILAGLYPAFYLSSFRPIDTLKGKLSQGVKGTALRNFLVILQFSATVILLIGTFVIGRQMNFILNTKLGFDKEQVVILEGTGVIDQQMQTFKQRLLAQPNITSVTVGDYFPIEGTHRNRNTIWDQEKRQSTDPVYGEVWRVDHDYIKTLGMTIVEGRDFNVDMPTDSQAIIINQSLARELNITQIEGTQITNGYNPRNLIGIVEDFHFSNMKEPIEPLCLRIGRNKDMVAIKINSENPRQTIDGIQASWAAFAPDNPFRYSFMDESFAQMYDDVQRSEKLSKAFSIFAILIACMGLFALSTFLTEQRSKEVGIRKVLGASTFSIIRLLTTHFLVLVSISLLIGIPIGYYLMKAWLEDYVYSIELTWTIFAIAAIITVIIALGTTILQALRAALSNPVHTLRSE